MATPELLTVLCAGAVRYTNTGGRGHRDLEKIEIAGVLRGLHSDATHLALAKYCGDEKSESALVRQVMAWATKTIFGGGNGNAMAFKLAALAVYEVVRPRACGKCGGSGVCAVVVCRSCAGGGIKPLSHAKLAQVCDITETTWRRNWAGNYSRVYQYVTNLDADVVHCLKKN